MSETVQRPETSVPAVNKSQPVERGHPAQDLVNQNLDPEKGPVGLWASFQPSSARGKALLYNAITGKVKPIEDMMGETIMVRDLVFQGVELANAVTGELKPAVRIVLIDTDGKCYGCVSDGIRKALKNAIGIVGMPSWPEGMPFIPRKEKAKQGNYYTLEMGMPPADEPDPVKPPPTPPKPPAAKATK